MAPRIATRAAEAGTPVTGLVLFAAPARPLLDILVEQNRRLAVLDDARTSPAEAAAIDKLRAQVGAIRASDADSATLAAEDLPLGQPAAYWRSTDAVDPVAEARAAGLPMLVLQGARDIQVVDADWQAEHHLPRRLGWGQTGLFHRPQIRDTGGQRIAQVHRLVRPGGMIGRGIDRDDSEL